MLVTSILSFSNNLFKSLFFQWRKNSSLCGKEFSLVQVINVDWNLYKTVGYNIGKEQNAGRIFLFLYL